MPTIGNRRTLLTITNIMRAVQARPASKRNVDRFVSTVERLSYLVRS